MVYAMMILERRNSKSSSVTHITKTWFFYACNLANSHHACIVVINSTVYVERAVAIKHRKGKLPAVLLDGFEPLDALYWGMVKITTPHQIGKFEKTSRSSS